MKYIALVCLMMVWGCTPEQSKALGEQPKKTVDRVTTDVNKAMQNAGQGSERLREEQK
jgi:hypothetical protein